MIVADLIKKLQAFDPSMRVVTPGFDESGVDDLETCELCRVLFSGPCPTPSGHHGAHDFAKEGEGDAAVLLSF